METQAEWERAFLKALGGTMLRVRQERGLSQEQLAEAARVHENTVRLLEQGKRMPSVLLLVQVAAGLACSPTELLDGVLREVGPIPLSDADGEPDHP